MDLSYDDVLEILQLVENSTVEYLEVCVGETKLTLDKSGQQIAGQGVPKKEPAPIAPESSVTQFIQDKNEVKGDNKATRPSHAHDGHQEAGKRQVDSANTDAVQVKAPVVGVFYRQPEPGAPPFVEVGSRVGKGDTVGLLEVMKMFTSVTAPTAGTIKAILADNNEFVEFDQPLMLIGAETTE